MMLNNSNLLMLFLILGALVFCIKILPLLFCKNKIKNRFLQSFLMYIPYVVITSMLIPEVFSATSSVWSATIAIVIGIILAYIGKSLLTVVLSSVATVFVIEQIMSFLAKK